MSHQAERLELLEQAGCTEEELCMLAYMIAKYTSKGGTWAVGVVCDGIVDRTGRNSIPPNVAVAIVRDGTVFTFLPSRTSQFNRPDRGRAHFDVEHTRLRRM